MLSKLKLLKKQDHVLGINDRNCSFVYEYNPRKYYPLANDKILCKNLLKAHNIASPKSYFIIDSIGDIELMWEQLNELNSMVIKPSNGSGGNGIMVLKKEAGQWKKGSRAVTVSQIKQHIANILFGVYSFGSDDRAIIEELIVSHEFLHDLYPHGVADLRLITVAETIVMAMLRLPTEKSQGKANIHQGGLGIGIELESGKLLKVYNGKGYFDAHPETNQQITGKHIPYWKRIKEIALECAKVTPLKYLGVDIVIDQHKGPMVMELNARPGLEIQNVNQKGLNQAIQELCK